MAGPLEDVNLPKNINKHWDLEDVIVILRLLESYKSTNFSYGRGRHIDLTKPKLHYSK